MCQYATTYLDKLPFSIKIGWLIAVTHFRYLALKFVVNVLREGSSHPLLREIECIGLMSILVRVQQQNFPNAGISCLLSPTSYQIPRIHLISSSEGSVFPSQIHAQG